MKAKNIGPLGVDFNNCDIDGAVRLHLPRTSRDLKRLNLKLSEGLRALVSDGEVELTGTVTFRDGIWVLVPDEKGYKNVDEKAEYHINNVTK